MILHCDVAGLAVVGACNEDTCLVTIMHANNEVGCNKQTACVFVRTESTQIPSAPIGTGRQCVADR